MVSVRRLLFFRCFCYQSLQFLTFFIQGGTQFFVEKRSFLHNILDVPMDTSFHNSVNKLLMFSSLFLWKHVTIFVPKSRKSVKKTHPIFDMTSGWLLFRLRRHLGDAFGPLLTPFGLLLDPRRTSTELQGDGREMARRLFWWPAPPQGSGGQATRRLKD